MHKEKPLRKYMIPLTMQASSTSSDDLLDEETLNPPTNAPDNQQESSGLPSRGASGFKGMNKANVLPKHLMRRVSAVNS